MVCVLEHLGLASPYRFLALALDAGIEVTMVSEAACNLCFGFLDFHQAKKTQIFEKGRYGSF